MVMLIDELSPTARDLLRDLPDMLSGKEPFLTSAAAKRALREDPGCKEVLLAIADVVAGFQAIDRRRRIEDQSIMHHARIAARVRRSHKRALAHSFWSAAFDAYMRAMSGRRATFVLGGRLDVDPTHSERIQVIRNRRRVPRDEFEVLLAAFDALSPNDAASRFLRVSMADAHGDPIPSDAWMKIGRDAVSSHVRGLCLSEQSHALVAVGDLDSALGCIEAAVLLVPSVELIYNATLVCALKNDHRALSRFAARLESAWDSSTPDQRDYVRARFVETPEVWTQPSAKLRSCVDVLWSIVGAG